MSHCIENHDKLLLLGQLCRNPRGVASSEVSTGLIAGRIFSGPDLCKLRASVVYIRWRTPSSTAAALPFAACGTAGRAAPQQLPTSQSAVFHHKLHLPVAQALHNFSSASLDYHAKPIPSLKFGCLDFSSRYVAD